MAGQREERSAVTKTSDIAIDENKTKGYGNIRHGGHLVKTTQGVTESEDIEDRKT
ncbi:MAG: hypothetical protein M3258_08800 [Thermoproteota archaeon]|jgi:hypothetical protein|nr:hypothetical protein [Thermoproteota archaeon]